MKLKFIYSRDEDVWCLLNKGKTSNNQPTPTEAYKKLIESVGENPDETTTSIFIDQYLKEGNHDIPKYLENYKKEFGLISEEFEKIVQRVFGVALNEEITVYLTVNNRCPYSIKEKLFFVPIAHVPPTRVMMHELWHFYTWQKFGASEMEKLGPEKYNDIKEALTVLLNVECKHLLRAGEEDKGYPQHKELRNRILELWKQKPDIDYVWEEATKHVNL